MANDCLLWMECPCFQWSVGKSGSCQLDYHHQNFEKALLDPSTHQLNLARHESFGSTFRLR